MHVLLGQGQRDVKTQINADRIASTAWRQHRQPLPFVV
jgi:hypothetical protein